MQARVHRGAHSCARLVADNGSSGEVQALSSTPVVVASGAVLVSYSYFEKDDMQRTSLEFFMAVRPTTFPVFITAI